MLAHRRVLSVRTACCSSTFAPPANLDALHGAETAADCEATIRVAAAGQPSEIRSITLPVLLREAAEGQHADRCALRVERVDGVAPPVDSTTNRPPDALPDEEWTQWTWRQYYDESAAVAKALMDSGVEQFGSVAIFGFNSPEWLMASQAAIMAGAKTAGIYPTDTPDQIAYKCSHSDAKVIVLEDAHNLEKFAAIVEQAPGINTAVVWNATGLTTTELRNGAVKVKTWAEFRREGDASSADLEARLARIQPGHCCALIYTSGTTGRPKAVMVSHDNIFFESCTVLNLLADKVGNGFDLQGNPDDEERIISYLPLSHVAGMMVDIVCPVAMTARRESPSYCTVSFARPYDLKLGTLAMRLQSVRPTMFLGAHVEHVLAIDLSVLP
jgi:long-chain-fatty-acid--CoA ligase ACSBG